MTNGKNSSAECQIRTFGCLGLVTFWANLIVGSPLRPFLATVVVYMVVVVCPRVGNEF